jgi:hypothetical protein
MIWIRDVALPYQGDDCLTWPFTTLATGYGRIGRERKNVYAHRYICEWVHGPAPEPHYQAAHSCGRGHEACVNPRHLRWATPADNNRDGRRSYKFLGMTKAAEIRALKGKMREDAVAALYQISERTVRRVFYGQSWLDARRKTGRLITRADEEPSNRPLERF